MTNVDISVLLIVGLAFTYFVLHVFFRELSLYYSSMLVWVGLSISILADLLTLVLPPLLTYGMYMVAVAIGVTCMRCRLRYILMFKLFTILYRPLMLIPLTPIYLIVMETSRHI